MYSIIEFDPYNTSTEVWDSYFTLHKKLFDIHINISDFILLVQHTARKRDASYRLICKEENAIGMAFYGYSKRTRNEGQQLYMVFENIITEMSVELIDRIVQGILTLMRSSNADSFLTTTDNTLIRGIIDRFHGEVINTINYYFLPKKGFDIRLSDQFENENLYYKYGLTVEIQEYVPEHLYVSFSALMTELMNDIIRNNSQETFEETAEGIGNKIKQFKGAGIKMLLYLLFDQSRQMIGLSFVLVYPNSTVAKQELTGVKKQYRGQKIASCLKAAITNETFLRYPQIDQIETNCYSVNLPIIRINKALGYSLQRAELQFQVYRDKVAAAL